MISVIEELAKLTRLQELDFKIDRAKKLVSSGPQAFALLEKELGAETANLNSATNQKTDMEKQKRQLETDNLMDQDRIKNIESRLGAVTNNKEFHAASKEGDKAKKMISDREKMIADLAEKIVAQQTKITEIQTRVDALNTQLEQKRSEVGSAAGEAEKEIAAYAGDRNAIVSEIAPPVISRYNRIRTRYSDALVPVINGRCTSCNMVLPPQLYIQVQKGVDFISCPSCQRLVYHKLQ